MANLKELRQSWNSTKSMIKITSAMQMISSTKFKKVESTAKRSFQFCESFLNLKELLGIKFTGIKQALIVFSGDRGLCGSFNNNVKKKLNEFNPNDFFIGFVGKKVKINAKNLLFEKSTNEPIELNCQDFSRIDIIYTHFISLSNHEVRHVCISNYKPIENQYTLKEIDKTSIYTHWIKDYINIYITYCRFHSYLCEHTARMVAMDNATRNAKQIEDELKLEYNKTRQSMITEEITEITAGINT